MTAVKTQKKTQKSKNKTYTFSEVQVLSWEMIGVVNGRQKFEFDVFCEHKPHLGIFNGVTRIEDPFVVAIKAHPDYLYDVELSVSPTGVCKLLAGKSYKAT